MKKLIEFLKKERERGKIILISTHIKEDLFQLADVIYQFDDGKVKEYEK